MSGEVEIELTKLREQITGQMKEICGMDPMDADALATEIVEYIRCKEQEVNA